MFNILTASCSKSVKRLQRSHKTSRKTCNARSRSRRQPRSARRSSTRWRPRSVSRLRLRPTKRSDVRKAEEAKAAREGRANSSFSSAPAPAPAAAPSRPAATHNEARLRLQTPGGNIMKTLPAETTLFEVAQIVEAENGSVVTKFVQNFPRKVFEGNLDFGQDTEGGRSNSKRCAHCTIR